MDKAFLFIFKFPTYIRYDEVASVSFERITASESLNRSFDLEVSALSTSLMSTVYESDEREHQY